MNVRLICSGCLGSGCEFFVIHGENDVSLLFGAQCRHWLGRVQTLICVFGVSIEDVKKLVLSVLQRKSTIQCQEDVVLRDM